MPEYTSGRKRTLSVGIKSYTENTNALNVVGNAIISSGKIGIGTTAPLADLHVVGLGTTTHVSAILASAGGITTTGGDLYVAGTLHAQDVDFNNLNLDNINTAGVSTFNIVKINSGIVTDLQVNGITTLNTLNVNGFTSTKDLYVDDELFVVGIATANTINAQSGIITNLVSTAATINSLNVDNIISDSSTGIISITNANIDYLVGIGATITDINATSGIITNVLGVGATFNSLDVVTGTVTNLSGSNLNYTGISTLSTIDVIDATIDNLQTVNITNTGVLTAHTLDVSTQFEVHAVEALFHENVVINGDLTVNGQQTIINSQEKYIKDHQIVLGYSTTNNTNDLTANGGGIAIASSVGNPIVDLYDVGVNTIPSTYKQLIWTRANTYGLGSTDAFLFNYAVGIGSSFVPNGVRFAVKEIQFTDNIIYSPYILSGIVTATNFVGNLIGIADNATGAGIATSIRGGVKGSVPYQSAPDNTAMLPPGTNGHVLITPGTGGDPFWGPVSAATGFFGGVTVRDDNDVVGTAASIGTLNFAEGLVAIAATGPNGIATISLEPITFVPFAGVSTSVIGGIASVTHLNVTGISTLGIVQINTNGIITSTNPGVSTVVYYGDGSKLTGVTAFSVVNQGLLSSPVYPTFANSIGVTTVGIASTQVAYIPSSGNFGIGTTSPTSKLHVVGDGLFTGIVTASRFVGEIDGGSVIGTVTYSSFSGIATSVNGGTGSLTSLTVSGITTIGDVIINPLGIITSANPGVSTVVYYGDGSKLTGVSAFSIINQPLTSTPVFPTFANSIGVASVGIASTQFAYIPSSGNLGIGTTNPTSKLHVVGDVLVTGIITANSRLNVGVGGTIITTTTSGFVGVATTNPIQPLQVNSIGSNIVVVDNLGELGIGTSSPTSKLHVIGNALITGVTTSTDFNSSSDRNLKTNIKTIEDPIDKVMRINGVTFEWKATHKTSAGVIAQDVEAVMPELVSGDPLTLNYNGLIGLLVEVVKQQQNEINTLKRTIGL